VLHQFVPNIGYGIRDQGSVQKLVERIGSGSSGKVRRVAKKTAVALPLCLTAYEKELESQSSRSYIFDNQGYLVN